jgi:hypothetical protein
MCLTRVFNRSLIPDHCPFLPNALSPYQTKNVILSVSYTHPILIRTCLFHPFSPFPRPLLSSLTRAIVPTTVLVSRLASFTRAETKLLASSDLCPGHSLFSWWQQKGRVLLVYFRLSFKPDPFSILARPPPFHASHLFLTASQHFPIASHPLDPLMSPSPLFLPYNAAMKEIRALIVHPVVPCAQPGNCVRHPMRGAPLHEDERGSH